MSDCRKVQDQLPWFAGDDLAPADAAAVRAHLVACHPCRTEAGGLVRSVRALRATGATVVPGVDDAFFAANHRVVMARVAAAADTAAAAPVANRLRWLPRAAAAVVLFGAGLWLARPAVVPSLLDRPAVVPVGAVRAVPWAGPRAMRPLSFETREEVPVQGLMGRLVLRTLEDGEVVLPPPPRRKDRKDPVKNGTDAQAGRQTGTR